jgi:ubiquinone/menaquinone biosynthesis C-methylase UbiE
MILDATCGLKEMWHNKNPNDVIFLDIRKGKIVYNSKYSDYTMELGFVNPTILGTHEKLPFRNESFDMIVFDPPHIISHPTGILHEKYTTLKKNWVKYLYNTTKELFRVLKKEGFLIFKWAETSKPLNKILAIFPYKPYFGTNTKSDTYFIVFRKNLQSQKKETQTRL